MPRPPYPPATRLDLVEDLFGNRVADPYRWLEDPAAEQTQAWSAAQDDLARSVLDALPGREALRARLTALLAAGLVTPPVWRGERSFFTRRTAEQEHAVLLVAEPQRPARVLLDPSARDPSGTTTLDAWQPDKEGRLLAYQLSSGGDEESAIRVLDVGSGADVDGPVDRTRYSPVAWLPGGEAFYYVRRLPAGDVPAGEEQLHRRVLLHRLGSDPAGDVVVHGDGLDKTNYYGVSVSRDGRWLAVSASAGTAPRTDVWLADLAAGPLEEPALQPVQVGVDARTAVHVGRDGRLYVLTDREAPRGRLCVTSPTAPTAEHWVDLVPEDPEAVLEDFAILDGDFDGNPDGDPGGVVDGVPVAAPGGDGVGMAAPDSGGVLGAASDGVRGAAPGGDPAAAPAGPAVPVLLVARTRHAVSELAVHRLADGSPLGPVAMPGLGSLTGLTERPEGGAQAWFGYTDHVTPPGVYCYDARTGAVTRYADPPGSVDVPVVHARQLVYDSTDGTPVRMFVLSGADGPDRPRPTVLYGYGGFGVPLTPGYSAAILAWVEAGGVYAVANLRGGSEEGEAWHRAGMREHKQQVFDDFGCAARRLLADGWTAPGQLGVSGGSNGGLLVGAALTQFPEVLSAAVCSAPLLDMVRYERVGLGVTWNDEYGTAERPDELAWLLLYSPYHRVVPGTAYPATLFTVFDADSRVDPMHARKMCAALQYATAGDAPILLRRESDVGHAARSVSRSVNLSVDTLSFLAAHTGLPLPP